MISTVRDTHNTVSLYGLCNTYVCIYVCTCRSDGRNNDNNTCVSWPTTTMISQCQNVVWKRTTLSRTTKSTCKTRLVNPLSLSHPSNTDLGEKRAVLHAANARLPSGCCPPVVPVRVTSTSCTILNPDTFINS